MSDPDLRPPNLLLVLVDCLRADAVERRWARLPAFGQLVAEGTWLDCMIASAVTTSPAVAALLTGRYSFDHGIRSLTGYKLSAAQPTLPERLRDAGYRAWAEVTGPLGPEQGLDRGFDEYGFRASEESVHGEFGGRLLSRLAAAGAQPWFGLAHLWELHEPCQMPGEFDNRRHGRFPYERALAGVDRFLGALLGACDRERTIVAVTGDHGEIYERRGGAAERIAARLLGRRDHRLRRRGHGWHLYEPLVRVPFFLWGERIARGRRIARQLRQIDVGPTFAAFGGTSLPGGDPLRCGSDLSRWIDDGRNGPPPAGEPPPPAYMEATGVKIQDPADWLVGLRTPAWKLIMGATNKDIPPELYDLRRDPREQRNRHAAEPAIAAELRAQLDAIRGDHAPAAGPALSDGERQAVEDRLRGLGYL